MKKAIFFFAVVSFFSFINAETPLSGEIKNTDLDSTGNPYIVDHDTNVVVPSDKKFIIHEGCVFLFKERSGLHIYGNIIVAGTSTHPVIFTSINDAKYNPKSNQLPNPFDWNGILIEHEAGRASFENFQLQYSTFGIQSKSDRVVVRYGNFMQNGTHHYAVNDKLRHVNDNITYSDPIDIAVGNKSVAQEISPKSNQANFLNLPPSPLWLKIPTAAISAGAGIGGYCLDVQVQQKAKDNNNAYAAYIKNPTHDAYLNYQNRSKQNVNDANNFCLYRNVLYGVTGVCAVGFVLEFFF